MSELIKQIINQRTFIKLPIERVYNEITSPDCWNSFFTTGLTIDLKVGGDMVFSWKDWGPDFYSVQVPCTVVACNYPNLFAFEWGQKMRSKVEFHLESKYGGTIVHVKEFGYPKSDEGFASMLECASGWGEAVTLLKFYLEHGIVYTPPEKD